MTEAFVGDPPIGEQGVVTTSDRNGQLVRIRRVLRDLDRQGGADMYELAERYGAVDVLRAQHRDAAHATLAAHDAAVSLPALLDVTASQHDAQAEAPRMVVELSRGVAAHEVVQEDAEGLAPADEVGAMESAMVV